VKWNDRRTGRPSTVRSLGWKATVLSFLLFFGARNVAAHDVYVGTANPATGGVAHVYRYAGGLAWEDLGPPVAFPVTMYDLAWHDDHLWACGMAVEARAIVGFAARLDGLSWTSLVPLGSTIDSAGKFQELNGRFYLLTDHRLYEWTTSGLTPVGASFVQPFARAASDPCDANASLYLGENNSDEFMVLDPLATFPASSSCGAAPADFTMLGCFAGSCIHSMAMHELAGELLPYAGAYHGRMYRFDSTTGGFVVIPGPRDLGNVTSLATLRSHFYAGTSAGNVVEVADDGSRPVVTSFTNDFPVSALTTDTHDDVLWIGFGGARFSFSRIDGHSMIGTWDGSSFTPRSAVDAMDGGVQAILAVDPPTIATSTDRIACLWPPNHRMVTFTHDSVRVDLRDGCGRPSDAWRFTGCDSDQPPDVTGDGHFEPDCVVAPDGMSVSVRAERRGDVPGSRHYAIEARPTAQGAVSALVGYVEVPHDRSAGCR
jgi:hypothetical protein